MKILLVNPNTTASMTQAIAAAARAVAAPGTRVLATQPGFGPVSIESHYDEAVAAAGVAEQVRLAAADPPDATVLACFGDPDWTRRARRWTARCWASPRQPSMPPPSWPPAFPW